MFCLIFLQTERETLNKVVLCKHTEEKKKSFRKVNFNFFLSKKVFFSFLKFFWETSKLGITYDSCFSNLYIFSRAKSKIKISYMISFILNFLCSLSHMHNVYFTLLGYLLPFYFFSCRVYYRASRLQMAQNTSSISKWIFYRQLPQLAVPYK